MGATDGLLDRGRTALERRDWPAARALYAAALDREETPEAAYGLARAVEGAGDYAAAIGLYERAFVGFRARGETRLPALIAGRELSFLHAAVYGNIAVADGWMSRARRLVESDGDCVERGWVELAEALMTDDPGEKDRHVEVAARIGRMRADPDLEFCALGYEGTCLVMRGRVEEGMRKLDESAAAASSGEVKDYLAAGEILCKMLLCCELVLDVRRAQQWVAVAESFSTATNAGWVSAICRMYYGGILTAAGRWPEAETELSTALDLYDRGYRAMRSGAVVRLADLRVRQGRLDDAARLLTGHESDPHAVQPLARLQLARGEVEVAATTLRRFLEAAGEHVVHASTLALLAEVELTAGHAEHARALCDRLRAITADVQSSPVRAFAEYAAGVTATHHAEGLAHLESAVVAFESAGLPLEEARTRLAIARLLAESRPQVAISEATRAHAVFAQLDAELDVDEAGRVLRGLRRYAGPGTHRAGLLSRRETEVLRLVAEGMSNDQIARRLVISKRTVEHHVGSILAKLGVATRAEAIAYAARHEALRT